MFPMEASDTKLNSLFCVYNTSDRFSSFTHKIDIESQAYVCTHYYHRIEPEARKLKLRGIYNLLISSML